ncbi:unnamed protein product [Aphanomyces euteiches]|uniref:Palmitoyltransferase n=1 Tax=Aphanomyces euteiches TaxID=100861 RepID=A0A6G0XMN4_9STRA|nr:hypothetical protein Ae201684_003329 [Aphanomyces euteiches]KAH9098700.1 hypothetical protein Ae201684P_017911 [Aphanomyces euteiches]
MCSSSKWKSRPPIVRWFLPGLIALLIVWIYIGFALNPEGLGRLPVVYWLYYNVVITVMVVCLARCMLAKVIVDRTSPHMRGDASIELKYNGNKRFCRKCNVPKPDRTHHCRSCGSCIAKMDHHCVFLNKCIGLENYKFFILFLGWSALACLSTAYLIWEYLFSTSFRQLGIELISTGWSFTSYHLQIVAVFFASLCVGLALTVFFLMHVYLTLFNMTTLEYFEKHGTISFINYYNVGVVSNLHQVVGDWSIALLPIYPKHMTTLRRDGFPINHTIKLD